MTKYDEGTDEYPGKPEAGGEVRFGDLTFAGKMDFIAILLILIGVLGFAVIGLATTLRHLF